MRRDNRTPEHRSGAHPQRLAQALGDEEDTAITAILALNPTYGEFHTALAWALGENDVMGEERRPLDGKAKQIHRILAADVAWLEDLSKR